MDYITPRMNPICGCNTDPENNCQVISLFTVFEYSECGLWYVEGLLQPEAEADLKRSHQSEAYLSGFATGYLDLPPSKREISVFNKVISKALELRPDASSLLDIGAGGVDPCNL